MLANNGYCPFTDQVIIKKKTAKNILPMMILCGMGLKSGKYVRAHGLPSKVSITGGYLFNIRSIDYYSAGWSFSNIFSSIKLRRVAIERIGIY
jgi:glutaminase